MKTWTAKQGEVTRKWWVVDANGKTLGRLATQIANTLRGKNKPQFTPHMDTGDFVVVINSDKVSMTGNKWQEKTYFLPRRSFGKLKSLSAEAQKEKDSTRIIKDAVHGMLPKNRLSRKIIKKLKVYPGGEHPHSQQKPEAMA